MEGKLPFGFLSGGSSQSYYKKTLREDAQTANNSFNRHVDGRGITDSYIIAKGIKFFFSELSTLANMKI
jgi:hypothetical protein